MSKFPDWKLSQLNWDDNADMEQAYYFDKAEAAMREESSEIEFVEMKEGEKERNWPGKIEWMDVCEDTIMNSSRKRSLRALKSDPDFFTRIKKKRRKN